MSYRYSVIVPHYDGSIDDSMFTRGINCWLNQSSQDFEILIYHDGPVSRPIPDVYKKFGDRCRLIVTEVRENDFGHSNRDIGIRAATGDYIIHFNPDNVVYPELLKELSKCIDNNYFPKFTTMDGQVFASNNIVIFPIHMIGHFRFGIKSLEARRFAPSHSPCPDYKMIFNGDPCVFGNIDCLQLVMKRELWLAYGGWYDKRMFGDGVMYERFVSEHGARYLSSVLGEHW
jgi:glycosyltransferase involved in cell wall biosynthesis